MMGTLVVKRLGESNFIIEAKFDDAPSREYPFSRIHIFRLELIVSFHSIYLFKQELYTISFVHKYLSLFFASYIKNYAPFDKGPL